MKKRTATAILVMMTGITIFAGCAETPESSLVKKKGNIKEILYEEQAEEQENTEVLSGKNIRETVGAPKTYQSETADTTGNLKIVTDATTPGRTMQAAVR